MTRGEEFERLVKKYEEHFKDHQLTRKREGIYLLAQPGTGIYASWIIFAGSRIIVTGDAIVGGDRDNGVISDIGYGPGWFAGQLSIDYMCSKFMRKEWDEDLVQEWVKDELEALCVDGREDGPRAELLRAIQEDRAYSEYEFSQEWQDQANDCEDWPPRDYNTAHAAMLATIQRTFARLWTVSAGV